MTSYSKSYSLGTGMEREQLTVYDIHVDYNEYKKGNPYNTTFKIFAVSGNFTGMAHFEYDIKHFILFINAIKDLYDSKVSTVELNQDLSYGSKISFELDKTGHVKVSGTLIGNMGIHSLTFEFVTDQTALSPFYSTLYEDFVRK